MKYSQWRYQFTSLLLIAIFALPSAQYSFAQTLDCEAPQDQSSMNQCAYLDWQAADKELNIAWKVVKSKMRETDSYQDENLKGAEKALVKSQRAWIDYRDGTCKAEGFQARGGTLEPLIYNSCLARLTRHRTEEFSLIAGEQR